MQLSDLMRTTAGDPPPTRIDLNVLVAGETRRARRLRWAGAGSATLAVLAVLTVASSAVLGAGGTARTGEQPGASGSVPTTPISRPTTDDKGRRYDLAVQERLDGVIEPLIRRTLPGVEFFLPVGQPLEVGADGGGDTGGSYWAVTNTRDPAGVGSLGLQLQRSGEIRGCAGGPDQFVSCAEETGPGGEQITKIVTDGRGMARQGTADIPGLRGYLVFVLKRNGTVVLVHAGNTAIMSPDDQVTRPEPPLTLDQMVQVALDPGLTI